MEPEVDSWNLRGITRPMKEADNQGYTGRGWRGEPGGVLPQGVLSIFCQ